MQPYSGMQAFFDGNFYGAYPGAELSADPFLSLINGSSGVGLPLSLTGLVANVSGRQVSLLCTAPVALIRPCLANAYGGSTSVKGHRNWPNHRCL